MSRRMHELLGTRQIVDGLVVFAGIECHAAIVGRVASGGTFQVSLRQRAVRGNEDPNPGHQTEKFSHAVFGGIVRQAESSCQAKLRDWLITAGPCRAASAAALYEDP